MDGELIVREEGNDVTYYPAPPSPYFFLYLHWVLECDSPIVEAILHPFNRFLAFDGPWRSGAVEELFNRFWKYIYHLPPLFTSWTGEDADPSLRTQTSIGFVFITYSERDSESDFQAVTAHHDDDEITRIRYSISRLANGALILRTDVAGEIKDVLLERQWTKQQLKTFASDFYKQCAITFGEYWKDERPWN
jgi:hypothetical protein